MRVPEVEEVEVFVVDDDRTSLRLLRAYIERMGHPVKAFSSAPDALDAIRNDPPKILITDIVMPELGGIQLAERARTADPDMGIILVTAHGDQSSVGSTMHLGVSSFLHKPVELDQLSQAVQRAFLRRAANEHHRALVAWMYDAMARNAAEIKEVTLGTLTSLINALDARSHHFRGHSRAVALQASAVGQQLGLSDDEIDEVHTAGLLHDIGMIGVPDAIVGKPDALTPEEVELIRGHCQTGVSIIEPMRHLGPSVRYVAEHHERLDGSGYPAGKRGDEISLGGQIVGIAEAWTGIIESRAYREGRSREEGMQILSAHGGEWFSAEVTDALLASDIGVIG